MDEMLPSRLGKLRIVCSLPLFSDAICIKKQSAAEHGFTQVLLSIAIAPQLKLSQEHECELIELAIFAEIPKSLLGDPSFYLRQRHPDVQQMYKEVRARLWKETESTVKIKTTRLPSLFALHELIDAYAASLFIEKEVALGNSFFAPEIGRTNYNKMRLNVHQTKMIKASHPLVNEPTTGIAMPDITVDWVGAVKFLDQLKDYANQARLQGGMADYSATFLGMVEKLKEHYRYKGWSYHYPESVGEHTFQVVFLVRILANALGLRAQERIDLYRLATLHDLAEAYASDVIYPVKIREKDLGRMHQEIEDRVIADVCEKLGMILSEDPFLHALVDICDRFSAQLYFDRERRSGNTHFNVPNTSMTRTREKYERKYPEVFYVLDELWEEYIQCFS